VRRRAAAAAVAVACLALTSCTATDTGDTGSGGEPAVASRVRVDTPALRTLKQRAGIETCPATAGRKRVADGLPEITLPCLGGGRSVTLSALRGPLVVNLFAQYCGPCRRELPFYQSLHAKGRGTVRVLGVDYLDAAPAGALAMVQRAGVSYPLVADPDGRLRRPLRAVALPGIVLVDRAGRMVDVEYRTFSSYAELCTLVERTLHVDLPA
jgi:cytochrome c biogenesis protein CcmG/thiol:disulfide interchange protein DsbE